MGWEMLMKDGLSETEAKIEWEAFEKDMETDPYKEN